MYNILRAPDIRLRGRWIIALHNGPRTPCISSYPSKVSSPDPFWRRLRRLYRWSLGLGLGWLPYGATMLSLEDRLLPSRVETSLFHGCNGTLPVTVRVRLAPGASEGAHWSENTGGAPTTRTYYVRVRGILHGPLPQQRIGAAGGGEYELYVTRVLEVKPPGQPNCVIHR